MTETTKMSKAEHWDRAEYLLALAADTGNTASVTAFSTMAIGHAILATGIHPRPTLPELLAEDER